jgi:CspA family cold shock protein
MPVGRVKWFDNRKGWGFVVQPDGTDLFVHYTSIVGDGFRRLDDGAQVEYEVMDGPKGKQAGNVRALSVASGGAPAAASTAAPAPAPGTDSATA